MAIRIAIASIFVVVGLWFADRVLWPAEVTLKQPAEVILEQRVDATPTAEQQIKEKDE